jgi:hypothetical protein
MEQVENNPAGQTGNNFSLARAAGGAGESAAAVPPGPDWPALARAFFLAALPAAALLLAGRSGGWRTSLSFSFGAPLAGGSLAWKPPRLPPEGRPLPKMIPSPPAWRLSARRPDVQPPPRAEAGVEERPGGNSPIRAAWARFSPGAWIWRDDSPRDKRRAPLDPAGPPPQKPFAPFRIGNLPAWPRPEETGPAGPPIPDDGFPAWLPFPALEAESRGTAAGRPPSDPAVRPPEGTPARPEAQPAETADWLNREITGPIPGAYLTIYPKLRFIGLCVPGQGYVRKYQQVGVPADLFGAKLSARDGRVPYGGYYIAERHRDRDGPRLFLSWPSPGDARRIGLNPGRLAEVENAWRRRALPPQNTEAGGGVGLNGLRNWVEVTEGGFSLEAPHMEEIFTALPDGAWVFIQP